MSWWDPRDWSGPGKQIFKVAKNIYKSTPFDNIYEGAKDISRGDWGGAARQLGLGALDTALWLIPGGAAVRGAGGVANLGRGAAARAFLKGAVSPGMTLKGPGFGLGTKAFGKFAGVAGPGPYYELTKLIPGVEKNLYDPLEKFISDKTSPIAAAGAQKLMGIPGIGGIVEGLLTGGSPSGTPSGYQYTSRTAGPTASSGGYGSSAAERRRKEEDDMEYYRSRIDAQKANTIEPFPEVIPPMGAPTTGAAAGTSGVAGASGAAPGGLVGLTPDQTYEIAMQDRLLQKQYDELLNQLALQEKQATLDTATSRYGMQREAATSAKDLGAQLAAAGMDFSPASAIGAEQLVQGNRIQQEAAATKNLANILSEIKQAKVKAKGDMDLGKLLNRTNRGRYQVSNTIGNIGNQYGMLVAEAR